MSKHNCRVRHKIETVVRNSRIYYKIHGRIVSNPKVAMQLARGETRGGPESPSYVVPLRLT